MSLLENHTDGEGRRYCLGKPVLDIREVARNGSAVRMMIVISGHHYYRGLHQYGSGGQPETVLFETVIRTNNNGEEK